MFLVFMEKPLGKSAILLMLLFPLKLKNFPDFTQYSPYYITMYRKYGVFYDDGLGERRPWNNE
jgi:hypothetical protein